MKFSLFFINSYEIIFISHLKNNIKKIKQKCKFFSPKSLPQKKNFSIFFDKYKDFLGSEEIREIRKYGKILENTEVPYKYGKFRTLESERKRE